MHHVQLWGARGQGRNHAHLSSSALITVLPAANGMLVETHYGQGTCRGLRCKRRLTAQDIAVHKQNEAAASACTLLGGDAYFLVDFPWGRGFLNLDSLQCPAAMTLPLIDRFLDRAADLFKLHAGTLARLRESLQGLGLEKLQERLIATANDAMEEASKLWNDLETKDVSSIMDDLKLKADEVLADPKMKGAFSAGIARLNCIICKAEGFDGDWVGQEDRQPRCVIKDAMMTWHWGDESELEIWGSDSVSTLLQGETFKGTLRPDGGLEWTDGDVWVRLQDVEKPGGSADATVDGANSDMELIQQSLDDLRRIVGGDSLEGDVEKAMDVLSQVATSDSEVKKIVDEMMQHREKILDLNGKFLESKTGKVLQEGQLRLTEQLAKLQDTDINPQLERMQQRGQRFLARVTTDRKVKNKALELFTATQTRLEKRWNDPNDPHRHNIEAWLTNVKERVVGQLSMHRALLVESLGGLELQQLDLRQLIAHSWHPAALEAQLQQSLVQAIKLSGMDNSGTELLDRFENAETVAQIPVVQRTYQGVLGALGDLDIDIPLPIRNLLEAQAAGRTQDINAWQEAIVCSLDDASVVTGAENLIQKGEQMLAQFHELKSNKTVAQVIEHLESEDMEREVLKHLHGLDPEQMLRQAEGALTSLEAREAIVGQLKDVCLDFVLKILPAINIEKVTGTDNGCDWEINDISFSDFHFRKENVHIALGNPTVESQDLLRVSAWDISAHFRKLKISVKQQHFPFIETSCLADAKAERMSVGFAFRLKMGSDTGTPELVLSNRSVLMDSLELWFGETNYAVILNTLSFLFADILKGYACQKILKHLDEHMGVFVTALNTVFVTCAPLLERIGMPLPALIEAANTGLVDITGIVQTDEPAERCVEVPALEDADSLLDWADPGRAATLRV